MSDPGRLLGPILALHARIRSGVLEACATQGSDALAAVADDGPGDTIYSIDRVSEAILVAALTEVSHEEPLCLVAEGLPDGCLMLPAGARDGDCRWRVLVDPIDGTRGLMYQKRSGWILTGVAPNLGPATRLSDIVLAVQTEIPLLKQHLSDQLWAFRGRGVEARRFNRLSGTEEGLTLRPSAADSIAHGFATVVRFFPGARGALGAVDDDIIGGVLPPQAPGKAACFEDQYASTGGEFYELMAGHDRFIADLRPLVHFPPLLCCHPYDICTALIAEELGVILTDPRGDPLDAPFNVEADVAWVGYANQRIRATVEPALRRALERHGLLAPQ